MLQTMAADAHQQDCFEFLLHAAEAWVGQITKSRTGTHGSLEMHMKQYQRFTMQCAHIRPSNRSPGSQLERAQNRTSHGIN